MKTGSYLIPQWPAPSNVRAVSTLRFGGTSLAPYDDFNLAMHVGDDPAHVEQNRAKLRKDWSLAKDPVWLDQVHSDAVIEAGGNATLRADASVARSTGIVCAILTADCLPVLFCSRSGDRVAAAHAGWRGLAAGVLDNTVGSLGLPGEQVIAWLGPAIGQAAFEVGDEVRIAFMAKDAGSSAAFTPNARGRWQCDLYRLARRALEQLGVHRVYGGDFCTFRDSDRFFSYRRDGRCGRMATLVWMQ